MILARIGDYFDNPRKLESMIGATEPVELKVLRPFTRYVCADQPCDEDRAARIHIPDGVRVAVLVRAGGRCRRCRSATNLEVDHLIPISKGGGSDESNLQTLCRGCNRRKWKKDAVIGPRPRIFPFLPLSTTRFQPAIRGRRPAQKARPAPVRAIALTS